MRFLYNIGINIAGFFIKIASIFNEKLKKGVEGRNESLDILSAAITESDKTFWFHCASLGEYEQGLPVFEVLRKKYPKHKIVLTFFSPSGYEIRKNTALADVVAYLPLDTIKNAKRFLDILQPELTVFVKYDIWPNYLLEIEKRKHRAILISALFRPKQIYFKWYGKLFRNALDAFEHIFVQNENSKKLLRSIGIEKVSISGDTRYDRVYQQLDSDNTLPSISQFIDGKLCIVVGSSWPEDEALFIKFINQHPNLDLKYIIAPHKIEKNQIQKLKNQLNAKTLLYSEKEQNAMSDFEVLIVDSIGILKKIYAYADIGYIGGAMGTTGLHNILEPAIFSVPIIIGRNYEKFPEAFQMIANGGVTAVSDYETFEKYLLKYIQNTEARMTSGEKNKNFIIKNTGAVIQIMNSIRI